MAASLVSSSNRTNDEGPQEALRTMENLERYYIAIVSPNTMTPMLHLKKYGECTLVDPRACIHHYECAADLACILYAPVSLRYFHYMVHSGYISNKTRVVLHDTKHDTYVFAQVENIRPGGSAGATTVDDIISSIRRNQGHCRPGIDVLQAGTEGRLGYMFTQPVNVWKKSKLNGKRATTTRVLSRRDWDRRLAVEKELHDCQRKIYNENRKQEITGACRTGAAKDEGLATSFHIPILVIEAPFNIPKPEQNR